jgi:pyruvate kinase
VPRLSSARPAILLDLQGPKIRLCRFEGGEAVLETGSAFDITVEEGTVAARALKQRRLVKFTVEAGGPDS